MPNNIADLDDKALYLRVTWSKMINYASTFAKEFMALEDEFKSGKYSPEWDFERWLGMKCGMSYKLTYRMLAQVHRVATDAERERIKTATKGKAGRKKKVRTPAPPASPTPEAPSQAPQAPMQATQATQATVTQLRPQAQAQAQPAPNVVPMPTPLDRLAARIKAGIARANAGRQEWIEGQIDLCTALVEARDQFALDVEFGHWYDAQGFNFGRTARSNAITMGRKPDVLRKCLETTESLSIRLIYEANKAKFG